MEAFGAELNIENTGFVQVDKGQVRAARCVCSIEPQNLRLCCWCWCWELVLPSGSRQCRSQPRLARPPLGRPACTSTACRPFIPPPTRHNRRRCAGTTRLCGWTGSAITSTSSTQQGFRTAAVRARWQPTLPCFAALRCGAVPCRAVLGPAGRLGYAPTCAACPRQASSTSWPVGPWCSSSAPPTRHVVC